MRRAAGGEGGKDDPSEGNPKGKEPIKSREGGGLDMRGGLDLLRKISPRNETEKPHEGPRGPREVPEAPGGGQKKKKREGKEPNPEPRPINP